MGVTITAKNSSYDFDMGYGGFFNLRKNIAMCIDKEFGENYAELSTCFLPWQFEENDKSAERIINSKHLDKKYKNILDFVYMRDSGGEISYKVCKEIYDLIKDVDFENKGFRYAAYSGDDYGDFKKFLKECYSKHRKMRWF